MKESFLFMDGRQLEVGTFYCIGQNYAKHAREMGSAVSKDPVVFIKPPAAYLADGGSVILPEFSSLVHHEVELVVVIGTETGGISREDALSIVAGYGVGIDVTLRDLQKKAKEGGKPWAVAKGFVTSAPISRIVPASAIKDPNNLELSLKVNGETRQSSSTANMERTVEQLIEYLSKVFTLRPGDTIFTGTPEGVGQIVDGDEIEADLGGIINLKINVKNSL